VARTLTRAHGRSNTLTALLTLACAGSLSAQPPADPPDGAVYTLNPAPRQIAVLGVALHPAVAPSPNGRFYAALQTRPDPVLWIVPTDGGEPFSFRKIWAAYRPRWAPSGNRIGFIAAIGPPRVWTVEVDPETGRPVDPPRMLIRTGVNAFAFSPDGERVAMVPRRSTAAGASQIRIVDRSSRQVRVLLRENGMIYRVDWAPDGEFIYYGLAPNSANSAHQVRRVRLAGGRPRTVRQTGEFLGLSPDGEYVLTRPAEDASSESELVETLHLNSGVILRIELPRGAKTLGWTATSRALVRVAHTAGGDAVLEIPICPACELVFW
jgi:hypothetical protein